MDGNIEKTRTRKPRATVYLADDRAYEEILELLRARVFIVYTKTASTTCHKLVIKEEGF
ncbi:MAG: hypothetical protein NT137_00205 [Methanomassiliicoccales archaeon]|nr:hypothetical protein [Methanomassiliicoccales archaeon]